jgi:CheY-like chemotaxis protein
MNSLNETVWRAARTKPHAIASQWGLHVLIVEDDEADAYLIERALADNPRVSSILRACDGIEALELIEEGVEPDLVIIDLQMPRMDGFRLLIEMACRGHDGFPIVVLTSSTAKNDIVRSLFRGASKVISKPHSLEGLNREIATTIAAL